MLASTSQTPRSRSSSSSWSFRLMRLSYVVCDFKTSIGLLVDEDVASGVRPAMSFTELQRSFQN